MGGDDLHPAPVFNALQRLLSSSVIAFPSQTALCSYNKALSALLLWQDPLSICWQLFEAGQVELGFVSWLISPKVNTACLGACSGEGGQPHLACKHLLFTSPWPWQGYLSLIHQGQMFEHLLPDQCSSCTWRAWSRRIPWWKMQQEEKLKEGETNSSSACVCAGFPRLHLEGRAGTCSELGLCVIWSVAPVRASPAKISSSGDGAHVQEGEKAVMLWCKPVPIATEPAGSRVVILGMSR